MAQTSSIQPDLSDLKNLKFLVSLNEKINSMPTVDLQDVELRNLSTFDPDTRSLQTPRGIPIFREPELSEYPLDASKGYENMIFSDVSDTTHYEKLKTCHYIMKENLKPDFDFCTTRAALLRIRPRASETLFAIKFKHCIYLKIEKNNYSFQRERDSYQFKLRQYVFLNKQGEKVSDDVPVDQRDQIYGTYTATMGNLKLVYSVEIPGVDNTEMLDDLDNPDVLQKIRVSLFRGYMRKYENDNWLKNFRSSRWLGQAHFAGIKQLRLAFMDKNACVRLPIETHSITELYQAKGIVLNNNIQTIHILLTKIKELVSDEDCPYSAYKFRIINGEVFYERIEGFNEYSFLDEEYIDYIKKLYS